MAHHLFNIPGFDYDKILSVARKIDPLNFMDLAHDHILTGRSMKTLKHYYRTVNEIDYTLNQDTCNTCGCCNEIKPISAFRTQTQNGKTFTGNTCRKCLTAKDKNRNNKIKNHIMKLVKIELGVQSYSPPTLTFSKSGIFTISSSMAEYIKFKDDDLIIFLKDEEKPKNWYITLSKAEGFQIQSVNNGKYQTRKFQKKALLELMEKSLNIPQNCKSFSIGQAFTLEGITYYPLILNKPQR